MSGGSDRLLTWACISVLLHTGCAPPLNDGQAARAFPGADSVAGSDHTPRQSDDCLLRLVTEIPFETYGNWFTVMAKAGNQNVRMLIDTGTSTSIELGLALMDKADLHILPDWQMILTPYGPIGYKSAILSTFMLGDIEKVNVEAALVADDDYIPDGINGLIGAAFLRKFDIEIDPANSRIRFYQVQGCRDGLVPFDEPYATTDMHMDQFNTPQIPITVNDVVLYAHLDTGSAHSFFTKNGALRAGMSESQLKSDALLPIEVKDHFGNVIECRMHCFDSIVIADWEIRYPTLFVFDFQIPHHMVLGLDFIGSRRVFLSFATSRFFISRRLYSESDSQPKPN